ncbi:hypothetical protein RBSH_01029 [Rhodopirellula baltica SH28]|uniref:HPt domain-containing protein n=1 Tax=Rhodopirellula baltica SH28 TaxID=993517 RepID=K5CHR6_RHOBT|nr:hypothetical protein [Rhodopirellula baltica]EKK03580.1 hypothetical protein RBSH_01029 [Rhodopirellula baltica SH28]
MSPDIAIAGRCSLAEPTVASSRKSSLDRDTSELPTPSYHRSAFARSIIPTHFPMTEAQRKRFAAALQRVAGDEDMLVMLASIAAEDGPPMLEQVHTHVESLELGEAARVGHALKGLLSTFESGPPVDELQPMIDAARKDDGNATQIAHASVSPKLEHLLGEIEELAESGK